MARVSYKDLYIEYKSKYETILNDLENANNKIKELEILEDSTDDKYNQLLGKYNSKIEDLNIEYRDKYLNLLNNYNDLLNKLKTMQIEINHKSKIINDLRLKVKNQTPSSILKNVKFINGKFWLNGKSYNSVNEILNRGDLE